MGVFASDVFFQQNSTGFGVPHISHGLPPAPVPSFPGCRFDVLLGDLPCGQGVDTPMQVPLNFYKVWAPAMRQHAKTLGKESVFRHVEMVEFCRILGRLGGVSGGGALPKKTHYSGGLCLWQDERKDKGE